MDEQQIKEELYDIRKLLRYIMSEITRINSLSSIEEKERLREEIDNLGKARGRLYDLIKSMKHYYKNYYKIKEEKQEQEIIL